jgi:ABC-type branched-subunit amino acid transport system permease subunit
MTEPVKKRWGGVWSLWPAVAGVALHFVLREVLNPWLNASSDARFWSAVVLLILPLLFTIFALVRSIRPPSRP